MADIIIADQEFNSVQKKIDGYFLNIQTNIADYISVLQKVTEQGMSLDMQIANKLATAANEIQQIIPSIGDLQSSMNDCLKNFVEEIDEADQFLY